VYTYFKAYWELITSISAGQASYQTGNPATLKVRTLSSGVPGRLDVRVLSPKEFGGRILH
jgi:hypothetical protein